LSPAEAVAWLEAQSPSVIRLGLDRVHAALAALKNPHTSYPTIQVAGTNGKGSTCAFAAACLSAQGYKVGLYTSPHLERVNERFQISRGVAVKPEDGPAARRWTSEPISDEQLGQRILEVLAAVGPKPELTFFELGTVLALWHFAQERVDVAVLETGLGGRLDAVTCSRPAVTVITPVSFDHIELLGNKLSLIATEKAGILKPNVPVVVSRQAPEALEAIETIARKVGAPVRLEGRDFHCEVEPDGKRFTYRGMRTSVRGLAPGLRGPHQLQNATVAMAALELIEDRGLRISQDNARAGLAGAQWPGRLEEIPGTPQIVLDGAHNPAGAAALVAALDAVYPGRKLHLVFGVLADKDFRPMVQTLFPRCAAAYLTPIIGSPRSLDPAAYADAARMVCRTVETFASPGLALAAARAAAAPEDLVVCAGSLMLIGQVKEALG
jgi:dihydrofolate synthase/folylpolyglutamate synthase